MTADSTVSESTGLHPRVQEAARGELPPWARVDEERRAHLRRVAGLLEEWADRAGLDPEDRTRWLAAAWLHDCLKGVEAEALRELVDDELEDLPEPVLHGPATAARLRRDGVTDEELLMAVGYHTLGHPDLGLTGKALYAADFLEPGRKLRDRWRAGLRVRMPEEMEEVVREILQARLVYLLEAGRPVRPETMAFWNRLVGGEPWVHVSGR